MADLCQLGVTGMGFEMKEQDLLELYQLTTMYRMCYGTDLGAFLKEIGEKYQKATGGGDIRAARNPRGAGRKRVYTCETDQLILELRGSGMTLRRVAEATQCSVGHVQDVIKRQREQKLKINGGVW